MIQMIFAAIILLSPLALIIAAIRFGANDDEIPKGVSKSYGVRKYDVVYISSANWTGRP